MDEDTEEFEYRPAETGRRRRVPMLIAVPIIATCAALGALGGVFYPLFQTSPRPLAERAAEAAVSPTTADAGPAALQSPRASAADERRFTPAAGPPAAAAPPAPELRPRRQPVPSQPVRTVSQDEEAKAPAPATKEIQTGSVDPRKPSDTAATARPAAGDDQPAAKPDSPRHEASKPEKSAREAAHERRQRAKRLRRVYAAPASPSPQAPIMAPPSQSTFVTLVPAQ